MAKTEIQGYCDDIAAKLLTAGGYTTQIETAESNIQTNVLTPISDAISDLEANDDTCDGYIGELQTMLDDLIAQEKAEQASALLDSARLIETGAVTADSDISADLNTASLIYQDIIGGDDHFEQCEDAGDDAEDASSLD